MNYQKTTNVAKLIQKGKSFVRSVPMNDRKPAKVRTMPKIYDSVTEIDKVQKQFYKKRGYEPPKAELPFKRPPAVYDNPSPMQMALEYIGDNLTSDDHDLKLYILMDQ